MFYVECVCDTDTSLVDKYVSETHEYRFRSAHLCSYRLRRTNNFNELIKFESSKTGAPSLLFEYDLVRRHTAIYEVFRLNPTIGNVSRAIPIKTRETDDSLTSFAWINIEPYPFGVSNLRRKKNPSKQLFKQVLYF